MIPAFKQLGSLKQFPALKSYMQNHMLSKIIFYFLLGRRKVHSKWNHSRNSFFRFIDTYPDVVYIFPNLSTDLGKHSVFTAPAIIEHATRFQELIEEVLYKLDKHDELISYVVTVGRLHQTHFGARQQLATVRYFILQINIDIYY